MSADTLTLQLDQIGLAWPDRRGRERCNAALKAGLTWLREADRRVSSALLQLLAGTLRPLQGTVRLLRAGQPPLDLQAEHRLAWRHAVFCCDPGRPVDGRLSPQGFWDLLHGRYPDWQPLAVLRHAQALGLGPHWAQPLARLDTATRRKVWLVAALAAGTPVRLLDDPLTGLDEDASAYLRDQLMTAQAEQSALWLVASPERPWPADATPAAEWQLPARATDPAR